MRTDDVRRIKDRLDIVEVIGDYVRLRKAGNNFLGLCPFHEEKTPSFTVSPSRQTYHCFGCGQGGDLFSFVMEREGLSFREALEILAERAGVQLERGTASSGRERSLYDVMEKALAFFRAMLAGKEGEAPRAYLRRRDLAPEAWDAFQIGWAPSSWDSLWKQISSEGVSPREALDAGLVLEGKNGLYDRFRGRVMFPIRDMGGRLLAFGGRLIDGEGAKYVNSPEGTLYSKRRNLYLLHRAKEAVRTRDRLILVEGYMDAIRLHLHGFADSAASLGTSLTEEQSLLIKRLTDKCFICYDSDLAGQEAAIRGMYVLQRAGLDVRVVELPRGKDPDDLLSLPEGERLFQNALDSARPLVLHHVFLRGESLRIPEKRRKAAEDILEGMGQLSPVDVAPYLPSVAAALGIFPHELGEMLDAFRKRHVGEESRTSPRKDNEDRKSNPGEQDPEAVEAALCAFLWRDEHLRRTVDAGEVMGLLTDERLQTLAAALLSTPSLEELQIHWHSLGETFPLKAISLGGRYCDELGSTDRAWDILREVLVTRKNRREYELLKGKLSRGQASKDDLLRFREVAGALKKKNPG